MTDLDELTKLREATTRFYRTAAGKKQLAWLEEFESNLITSAITVPEPTLKADYLNQAKGLRAFKAYIQTLTQKR